MDRLLDAILDDDRAKVKALLKADRDLATRRIEKARLYRSRIMHWVYAGDTPLHMAAAGYVLEVAKLLVAAGADVNAVGKHRWGRPLHYAADGGAGCDAKRQVKMIDWLLAAGAEIDAQDKNGATALHRAVRTRCAAAVKRLLSAGADVTKRNKPGSTAFHLAVQDTGRGGSGSAAARAGQREIIAAFLAAGVSAKVKDGKGKTVVQCARQAWVREMVAGKRQT